VFASATIHFRIASGKRGGHASEVISRDFDAVEPNMAKVTLCGTPSLVEGDQWTTLASALEECLPLRSLHWKSSSRPSIRTIQELNITLLPQKSFRSDPAPRVMILDNPLLNIYVVSCDVSPVYHGLPSSSVVAYRTARHIRIPSRSIYRNGVLEWRLIRARNGSSSSWCLPTSQSEAKSDST